MSPGPLRIGVVGAGLGSAPHFKGLGELRDQIEVAWVHVRHPESLGPVSLPAGAKVTARYEDLLEDPRLQAVLVLTPPNTHLALVRQAALAGKHVLVEKPLDISLAKARALVEVCEAEGVQLAVMLQHRLRPGALALAALLETDRLGELLGASAAVRWWRAQSYYDEPGRGTLSRDGGGVLITQAIHTLDLLLSFTGLPQRVFGLARTSPVHRMEGEDCASAVLQFANGAIGTLEATTAAFPGYSERIELNFSQGTATLAGGELVVHFTDGQTLRAGASESFGSGANIIGFDHAPHRAVLEDFFSAARKGSTPAVNGRSALKAQILIEAILASATSGQPVDISPADQAGL